MKTTLYFTLAALAIVALTFGLSQAAIIVNNVEFPDDIKFYRENGDYFQVNSFFSGSFHRINGGPVQWGSHATGPEMSASWSVIRPGVGGVGGSGVGWNGNFQGTHQVAGFGKIAQIPIEQYLFSRSSLRGRDQIPYSYYSPEPEDVLQSLKAATGAGFSILDPFDYPQYVMFNGSYTLAAPPVPEPSGMAGMGIGRMA